MAWFTPSLSSHKRYAAELRGIRKRHDAHMTAKRDGSHLPHESLFRRWLPANNTNRRLRRPVSDSWFCAPPPANPARIPVNASVVRYKAISGLCSLLPKRVWHVADRLFFLDKECYLA
jgi:hypothetical protein